MSKVMLSLGSIIVGASLMFFMLSGNHTSMAAQGGIGIEGEVPIVPSRLFVVKGSVFADEPQQLDGLDCTDCTFDNVRLTYGGGEVRLRNAKFVGTTRVVLTGAARNAFAVMVLANAIARGNPKPKAVPRMETRLALAKAPITIARWATTK